MAVHRGAIDVSNPIPLNERQANLGAIENIEGSLAVEKRSR